MDKKTNRKNKLHKDKQIYRSKDGQTGKKKSEI